MTVSTRMRTAALSVVLIALSTITAAYGHGGSSSMFLNQYFLPADAQVQGLGGVIFGVLAPVGLVMILFYIALSNIFTEHEREATALAVLLALFTIPSGAYKTISELLIGLFGVAGGTTGPATGGGLFGFRTMELIAICAGIVAAVGVFKIAKQEGLEKAAIGGGITGIITYMAVLGQINPISAVFSLIAIYLGYRVFHTGITSSSRPGMIIGLLGLVFLTWSVRSAEFAPEEIQQLVGSFRIFAYIIIFLLIITMIVNIVFKGALLGGAFGNNP